MVSCEPFPIVFTGAAKSAASYIKIHERLPHVSHPTNASVGGGAKVQRYQGVSRDSAGGDFLIFFVPLFIQRNATFHQDCAEAFAGAERPWRVLEVVWVMFREFCGTSERSTDALTDVFPSFLQVSAQCPQIAVYSNLTSRDSHLCDLRRLTCHNILFLLESLGIFFCWTSSYKFKVVGWGSCLGASHFAQVHRSAWFGQESAGAGWGAAVSDVAWILVESWSSKVLQQIVDYLLILALPCMQLQHVSLADFGINTLVLAVTWAPEEDEAAKASALACQSLRIFSGCWLATVITCRNFSVYLHRKSWKRWMILRKIMCKDWKSQYKMLMQRSGFSSPPNWPLRCLVLSSLCIKGSVTRPWTIVHLLWYLCIFKAVECHRFLLGFAVDLDLLERNTSQSQIRNLKLPRLQEFRLPASYFDIHTLTPGEDKLSEVNNPGICSRPRGLKEAVKAEPGGVCGPRNQAALASLARSLCGSWCFCLLWKGRILNCKSRAFETCSAYLSFWCSSSSNIIILWLDRNISWNIVYSCFPNILNSNRAFIP